MSGVRAGAAADVLGADEMEALRLSDLMELTQVEAARQMGISQSTFQRVLTTAHRKAARSLVENRPLTVARAWDASLNGTELAHEQVKTTGGTSMTTHIALPTEDGTTLCQHFGRARYYKVVEIRDGKVIATELRDKFAHVCGDPTMDSGLTHEEVHSRLADAAHGCDTVIAGGMGQGAMDALTAAGMKVIQTDMVNLEDIVAAYVAGTLANASGSVRCGCHEGGGHGAC
jgi:predicted Fe-Mo cluster-binding NifX family protein